MGNAETPTIQERSFLETLDVPETAIINFREYLQTNTSLKQDEVDSLVASLGEYMIALPSINVSTQEEARQNPQRKYFEADTTHIRPEEKQKLNIKPGGLPVFEITWDNPRFLVPFDALNRKMGEYYEKTTDTLTSGAFGTGFVGFDTHLLDRAFIKITNPDLYLEGLGKEDLEKDILVSAVNRDIVREARLLGNFHGLPETKVYIPTVYDVGAIPLKGMPTPLNYVAMEFIEGSTVEKINNLSREEALDIGLTVAYVLDHMQKRFGARHLDMKPGNIIRAKDGRIVIIDWATTEGTYKTDSERHLDLQPNVWEQANLLVATEEYMAPERAYSSNTKSDQHSLAASVFEMLQGDVPEWITTRGSAVKNLQYHKFRDQIMVKPNAMPDAVYEVFAKAMAYNPEDRYSSCTEFMDKLKDAYGAADKP